MKTTDLMVGDLVQKLEIGGHYRKCRITAIFGDNVECETSDGEVHTLSVNGIKSIPLTAKNIEKNGFEGTPTSDLFIEKNLWETYSIELFPSEGSWLLRITDKTNEYICGCNRINLYINYIHELQHALKLCGIEKEIEL